MPQLPGNSCYTIKYNQLIEIMEVFNELREKNGGKRNPPASGGRTGGRIIKRGGMLIPYCKIKFATELFPQNHFFSISD